MHPLIPKKNLLVRLLKRVNRPSQDLRLFGLFLLLVASPLALMGQLVQVNGISTVAGNGTAGFSGDGGAGGSAQLSAAFGAASDSAGNLYIADEQNNRVRMVSAATGFISTFAGNGTAGFSGDGGAAASAELNQPQGTAIDASGNLYIADTSNHRIRMVSASTGFITTVAGNGTAGFSGDTGAATGAELNNPAAVAVDSAGNVYIADFGNGRVREVTVSTGVITTVAGNGTVYNGTVNDGQPAINVSLDEVRGVAVDFAGNIYVADAGANRIREVAAPGGIITTAAGDGTAGYSGDGASATGAELNLPSGVAVDSSGTLYIADTQNHVIRRVLAASGIISTVAGDNAQGYSGDGGASISAELSLPGSVTLDGLGNIYIADLGNNTVRKSAPFTPAMTNINSSSAPQNLFLQTTAAEAITSFTVPVSQGNKQEYAVGTVTGCVVDGVTSNAAGTICTVPITFSPAYPGRRPVPLQAVTGAGSLNAGLNGVGVGPLAALTPGIITTIAGNGNSSYTGDGGPAVDASMYEPEGIALDSAGNVFFSDNINNVIRRIDAVSGIISTVAGDAALNPSPGVGGFSGDGGPATSAQLYRPLGISFDSAGNLFIADAANIRIRKVDAATGIITTVAGNGTNVHTGDGGLAVNAGFYSVSDVKFDSIGNMFIAEGRYIRRVDAVSSIATTIAGNGPGGDGVPAVNSYVGAFSLAFDSQNNLYFTEPTQNTVRVISAADGYVTRIAGTGMPGQVHSGDGGPATSASLDEPNFLTVDSAGDVYITESAGNYVRMVAAASQIISTIGGLGLDSTGVPGDGGPATSATISSPTGITLDGSGNVYISSYVAERIRKINVSQSALVWPTPTNVGASDDADDPQTAVVTDIGNFQMNVPFATTPADPVITNGWLLDSASTCSPNGLSPLTLVAGQACTLPLDFTPTASGTNNGTLVLTDNSLNIPTSTQAISLTGTGVGSANPAQAVLSPTSLTFTTNATTAGANQIVTLSNPGGATLNISSIAITGANNSAFVVSATTCGATLAANTSCAIGVGFPASAAGTYNATLTVTDDASPTVQTASLTGTVTGTLQVTVAPSALNFVTTPGVTPAPQVVTITNTGTAVLSLGLISVSGNDLSAFSPVGTCFSSLAPGASCTVTITFIKTTVGSYAATLTVDDNASPGMQTVALTGTVTTGTSPGAPIATLTPAALSFSALAGTTPPVQVATLTNSGTAALVISGVTIGRATGGAYSQTNTCGASLAANASCAITVSFSGTGVGSYPAALEVADNAPNTPQAITLSGTVTAASAPGTPTATLTPASLTYTATTGLTSAAQTATLTNSGTATLNISGITLAGANTADFAISANTCGATLAAGANCTLSVTFTPSAAGSFTASLSVADDAAGSPQTSTLTGTGTAAAVADFTIAATPPTQSVAAGSAATYGIPVTSSGGSFTDVVTLTATGLPPGATVTFAPASVTPGAAGAQSTMTVQTAVQTATQTATKAHESSKWPFGAPAFAAVLLLIPGWRTRRRLLAKLNRGAISTLGCLLVLLSMMATITGCGAGFNGPAPTSPAGTTYTITVTGTSGATTHNTTVQITVR